MNEMKANDIRKDSTERRQAEAALPEHEMQLRLAFEAARLGTWDWDLRTGRVVWSPGHEALWGYAPGSFPGTYEGYESRLHPDDVEGARRAGQKAVDEHSDYEHEYRVRWPDGTVRWIASRGRAFYGPDHQATRMIGVAMDITERKRLEEALIRNETILRSVFQAAPIGICIMKNRVYQSANTFWSESFGYPEQNIIGKSTRMLYPSDEEYERVGQAIYGPLQERGVARAETRLRRSDGVFRDVVLTAAFLRAEDPTAGTVVLVEDVTERKRAEEEVRWRAALLEAQTNATIDGILVVDEKGTKIIQNQRCIELWKIPQHIIDNHDDQQQIEFVKNRTKDPAKFIEKVVYLYAHPKESSRDEVEFKDGTILDRHSAPVVGKDGTYFGRIWTFRDITERKQAEQRMQEQVALLEAANDAIYVRAADYTVTYWNAGAERLFGWPRAEALGRKITDLAGLDSVAFAAARAALLEQGQWTGELTSTGRAGKPVVLFSRWTLLRDEQGRPKEVLAINTDITAQKQLEANYLRAQRLEGIGALAGGIAHDLNNILAPILMVGPLLRETVSDPESRRLINTIESCAQRGADIIKQLLTFARGQPGARAPLPVRHLLNEMQKLVGETFPRNIQARVRVPKDLWPILGDATQIHQALLNLCVNARDALPEGGTLTLAAENVTLDEGYAALEPEAKPGEYVRVSVTDTGTGIAPEHLDRIFDPFFTTKEIGAGTGLGLATVLGIVRGHGGFVHVNSRVGQGTSFELYFPASPEAKAGGTPVREAPPPHGQGELVLVVDDEASVREMVRQILEKHGYRTIVAREGTEALALFGEHRDEVRVVITDMMMPGMDGVKLVRALRQLDARLPILGMTGLGERAGVKGLEALKLPVVLDKPFTMVNLLAAMSQTLAGPDQAPEAGPGEKGN
jgi:hypothetical protein